MVVPACSIHIQYSFAQDRLLLLSPLQFVRCLRYSTGTTMSVLKSDHEMTNDIRLTDQ